MFESLDKMMMAGLGALTMTREKAEELFDKYVSQGQAAKSEARSGFVKELLDSAEKTRGELEEMIRKQTRQVLEKMPLAKAEDITRLESKIDRLEGKIDQLIGQE